MILKERRKLIYSSILSFLLTIMLAIGWIYDELGGIKALHGNNLVLLVLISILVFIVFLSVGNLLFDRCCLQNNRIRRKNKCWYLQILEMHPFLTAFITLLVLYIPYLIMSYPAIFMSDTKDSICDGIGISVRPTTHHTFAYIKLIALLINGGHAITGSWNVSAAIASAVQFTLLISIISYGIYVLIKYAEVPSIYASFLIIYYAINPRIVNYMCVLTKDIYYVAFFYLFLISIFFIYKQGLNIKNLIIATISLLGVTLFRKDGIYVAVFSLVALLFFISKRDKKYIVLLITFIVAFSACLNVFVEDVLQIPSGSKREMLSIPLQQMGRYVNEYPKEINETQQQIILENFSFSTLEDMGNSYNPSLSDPIKNSFEYKSNDIFKVWLQLGLKRPGVYIESFLANYYQYFYPFSQFDSIASSYTASETLMGYTNDGYTPEDALNSDFHYPQALNSMRLKYESAREKICSVFPFSILNSPGILTWCLLLLTLVGFYKKNYLIVALALPLWFVSLICFASPCNGYFCRYQYPIFVTLPWIITIEANDKCSL